MALESNNYNQNFGFGLNASMFGNNPMNPTPNNSFTNQQLAYNLSHKNPVHLNFPNSAHQVPSVGGSSLNPHVQNFYVDPFLRSSSVASPGTNHSSYIKNNGLLAVSSSNEANLYKDYPGLIHKNLSQHAPIAFQALATNPRVNIQEFGSPSSANPCINGDKAVAFPKAKKNNERNNRNGNKLGHWNQDEDRMLLALVEKYGNKKWSYIARMMPGRLGKQLRERYNNHLKPGLKKEAWTEEEDAKLIQAHEKMGNKWAEISKILPGRSESDIKNRWNATKRKCINAISKTSSPKPSSLFENYVKNMFNIMGQSSSPTSAESTVVAGSSSGGSDNQQAVTNGSGGVDDGLMDYGLQPSFEPNGLADNNGPAVSQFESMSYLDMLLQ